jgi:hypothetical protein
VHGTGAEVISYATGTGLWDTWVSPSRLGAARREH